MARFKVVLDYAKTTYTRHTYTIEAPDADTARRVAEWDVYPREAYNPSPVPENVLAHEADTSDGGEFHTLITVKKEEP